MIAENPQPIFRTGRVALVTGSSTGLGKAMAFALGRAGAKVAISFQNNAERAEKTFGEFRRAGCDGILVRGDVTSEADVKRLVAEITAQLWPY
jgi:NAD(P)-dependent dehydrogenase (short-subunit alcohol dehydrogenase family)